MIGSFILPINTTSSGDTTAPTILSATVDNANPDKLVVVISEVVTITNTTGLTITGDATPTLSAPTSSGSNVITFTLSPALTYGQSVTLNVAASNTIKDAANNALAATTKAITNNVAAPTSYEAETTSFMNTLGITNDDNPSIYTGVSNNGVWLAVDEYITDLKTANIYTKQHYNYLRVGGDITKQAVDLIDPTRSGQYFGSWVFGKDGATANGTNCYFNAKANPLALDSTSENFGFSYVMNVSLSTGYTSHGIYSTATQVQLYVSRGAIDKIAAYIGNLVMNNYLSPSAAFHTVNRTAGMGRYYANGVEKETGGQTRTLPNAEMYEGAMNMIDDSSVSGYIEGDLGVTAYHQNLTASETLAFSNAVSKFETALGRKRY